MLTQPQQPGSLLPVEGIHFGVEFADYLGWNAISNSALSAAARSMAHYRARMPVEETPAMRLGSLVHAGQLEPLRVAERYVVMPAFEHDVRTDTGDIPTNPKNTKAYREKVAEFRRVNSGKVVVTQSEYDAMIAIVGSIRNHKRAAALLSDAVYEISICWVDDDSGLVCKGRIDCWQSERRVISDLKTTADVGRFERQLADRAYYRQLAMYSDGLAKLCGEEQRGALIAVESSPPYCVRAAMLSEDAMEVGRTEYKRLLCEIAAAKESGKWSGYESPDEWRLPSWMQDSEDVALIIGGKTVEL